MSYSHKLSKTAKIFIPGKFTRPAINIYISCNQHGGQPMELPNFTSHLQESNYSNQAFENYK